SGAGRAHHWRAALRHGTLSAWLLASHTRHLPVSAAAHRFERSWRHAPRDDHARAEPIEARHALPLRLELRTADRARVPDLPPLQRDHADQLSRAAGADHLPRPP